MALQKIADFDPNYKEVFGNDDIKGKSLYTEQTNEKIGTVNDALVDENGQFRYLVVDVGSWFSGKKVLLPIGRSRIDSQEQRVYALGMSKEQAEKLPKFNENEMVDDDYEEQVRGVYRPQTTQSAATQSLGTTAGLDTPTPLDTSSGTTATLDTPTPMNTSEGATAMDAPTPMNTSEGATAMDAPTPLNTSDRGAYDYQQEPDLYGLRDQDHQSLRLYEERLIANKRRQKTGEVAIGKHTETETQQVSVPVERERVVIERNTPVDAGTQVTPGEATFQSGEVAHMEIYEETADVRKEAFVREEISVRKEVDQETVEAEETIRREELDVDSQGQAIEDRTRRGPTGREDRAGRGLDNRI